MVFKRDIKEYIFKFFGYVKFSIKISDLSVNFLFILIEK